MENTKKSTGAGTGTGDNRRPPKNRVERDCLLFGVSLQEGFNYVKAIFVGQAKKVTAKNEVDATKADLETSKMQVDAADAAEDAKHRLDKTM